MLVLVLLFPSQTIQHLPHKALALKYHTNDFLRHIILFPTFNKGSSPVGGSGKRSPRYHCERCHVPSVQSGELYEQFLHLLTSLTPDPDMEKFLKEIIVRVWRDET